MLQNRGDKRAQKFPCVSCVPLDLLAGGAQFAFLSAPSGYHDAGSNRNSVTLPALLNQRTNLLIINSPHFFHRMIREWRQVGGATIVGDLFRALASWDGAGYGIEHENPAQSELAH